MITRAMGSASGNNWSVTALSRRGDARQFLIPNTFSYDAEGRILSGGSGTYVYDGDGNRVEKTASVVHPARTGHRI